MKTSNFTPRFLFISTIILIAALSRLIPHWPNFTPIAAIALFGGAYLDKKIFAFIVPLTALFISDLIIGFHTYMIAVYISFALTVMIGLYLKHNAKVHTIAIASISSSILFFLITNFSAWLASPIYPQNIVGLTESYVAGLVFFNTGNYGISFFLNDVLAGLFYNALLFGSVYFAKSKFPALVKA